MSNQTIVLSEEATPGRWYECEKYGRILCCGTTGGDWITAFAVRDEKGRTIMKYLQRYPLTESPVQAWDDQT